jgi:subtilisin family serine protease
MVRAISNQGNGFFYSLFRKECIRSVYLSSKVSISSKKYHGKYSKSDESTKCSYWHQDRIGVRKARELASGEGITIAVIDTGIDYEHPHLIEHFGSLKGYDFVKGDEEPLDENGHGTHVAGTCVCYEHGVSPGTMLYSVRILDKNGSGSEADLMAAMEWSADHGAHIWNMSLGSPNASRALEEMVYYFCGRGFYLVAAAGNDGGYFTNYPAGFSSVISCAATDFNNKRAYFSNINGDNDISAPGVDIVSCNDVLSGTSMSTPQISGSLALALSLAKDKNAEQFMEDSALVLGDQEEFGAGLVQADSMLEAIIYGNHTGKMVWKAVKNVLW